MSFKEKRLEEVGDDFLLVGIGLGVENQSRIPKIFKFLEDLGFKLTNEEQKKARDVAVLKRDPKKSKAFFGKVLKRRKNKESVMDKVSRSIKERLNVGMEAMYVVGDKGRKMPLSALDKKTLHHFNDVTIETKKNRALEIYLMGGSTEKLAIFPTRGDRVVCVEEGSRTAYSYKSALNHDEDGYYIFFIDDPEVSVITNLELRVYLSPKREEKVERLRTEKRMMLDTAYGERMKSLIEKAKAKKTEKPDKIDSKIEEFINETFDRFERHIEQDSGNPARLHVPVDGFSREDFETLLAEFWEIGFIVVCFREEGQYRYIEIQLSVKS